MNLGQGLVNDGLVELTQVGTRFNDITLRATGGTIQNRADGTIVAASASGTVGARIIDGPLDNAGRLQADVSLTLIGEGAAHNNTGW